MKEGELNLMSPLHPFSFGRNAPHPGGLVRPAAACYSNLLCRVSFSAGQGDITEHRLTSFSMLVS